jgi:murein DD-endopeptidase MepM/ murein hydrolase activator NlpD
VLLLATTSSAQQRIFPTPTPSPYRPPPRQNTPTPPPSAAPTQPPEEEDTPIPLPEDDKDDKPKPKGSAAPSPGAHDDATKDDKLPEELEKENFKLVVPNIARTRPRNTGRLVDLLEPLTAYGLPLQQVLVEGMGRFPVAGVAWYRDDWLNPRYNPEPHLHRGLDIWADYGTPIRSPDRGYVQQFLSDPLAGGLGVKVRGTDGTVYYFGHLAERAEGLYVGQRVALGQVIGYVGSSGNADGGPSHLHFEIRRPDRIPPKPSVDKWLDEAIELAPRWVEMRKRQLDPNRAASDGDQSAVAAPSTKADLDTSMLLTLLDPVGGSVGLLPKLDITPTHTTRVSSGLMLEVIRQRLDGYMFAPSTHGVNLRD